MVDLTDVTAIVGAISGSVSLGLVVYKTLKDKPKLVFDTGRKFFMQPNENDNFTSFIITMMIHNKGERSTTIHSAKLAFEYEGKSHELDTNFDIAVSITPDSSISNHFMFNLPKKEMRVNNQITNCSVIVNHTHGRESILIGDILELH